MSWQDHLVDIAATLIGYGLLRLFVAWVFGDIGEDKGDEKTPPRQS